jgi:aspartyl protease family protein
MQKILGGLVVVLGVALGLVWAGTRPSAPGGPLKEVVLERSSNGHFYADVAVNGHPVRFLVDTGAGTVALSEEDAAAAGVAVDPASYSTIGEGPSGIVRGKFVELDTLSLDTFAPADVKAAVVQGATESLLGQPFLDRLDEIIIRKDVMILRYS